MFSFFKTTCFAAKPLTMTLNDFFVLIETDDDDF